MTDKSEIKVTRTYSLDPAVIAWVTQRAARQTMANLEADGKRVSDSEIVNSILTAAMESDIREQAKSPSEKKSKQPASIAA